MTAFDVRAAAARARRAARSVATATSAVKDDCLFELIELLQKDAGIICEANERDLERARAAGISGALYDRLDITGRRFDSMIKGLHQIAMLPDPVGAIEDMRRRPNGMLVGRMRIPLGVIAVIYESRPNVTIDTFALCLKSGNAVVLKGGSEAIETNRALVDVCERALSRAGLPYEAVQFVDTTERSAVGELLELDDLIDLVIPRGGEGLIRFVTRNARMPVVQHYKGVCHVYVDGAADLDMAESIAFNAKVQRPGVCNAMETLLVDAAVAPAFLPRIVGKLRKANVEVRGCERTRSIVSGVEEATEDDWSREYLDLILSIRVVDGLEGAIEHIARYGSRHTEAIVTNDHARAMQFLGAVEASCVLVNASTRFNDGFELGLGAEIGISTSKVHAFGPMGLEELTARKFVVLGQGQVRT